MNDNSFGKSSKSDTCNCSVHGKQGIGLVCVHIAYAVDSGAAVGFFSDDTFDDLARPDAWCKACEERLLDTPDEGQEQWFHDADFKIFCAACWDEAKNLLAEAID